MKHAIKQPGDELREGNKVGAPPKHQPEKPRQVSEQPDELDVTRGQNAEKGNTLNPRNIRTGEKGAH